MNLHYKSFSAELEYKNQNFQFLYTYYEKKFSIYNFITIIIVMYYKLPAVGSEQHLYERIN